MSKIIRRGHLILVAAFGKRLADPPISERDRRHAEIKARIRAREEQRRNR